MSIESDVDLAGMRAVGRAVAGCLRELRLAVRPGITTAELDAVCARELRRRGARPAPALLMGFPASACISVGDEAVHGIPGPRRIRPGDVVKLDVTAELQGYVADAAVTVVVPPASRMARELAACAAAALSRALDEAGAGRPLSAIGRAVEREVRRRGFRVLAEHCGHGTGRAVWERPTIPTVFVPSGERLAEGQVLALEPIIAAADDRVVDAGDGWTLRTRGGSLAAHAEHTIVVRRGRPLVLTAA